MNRTFKTARLAVLIALALHTFAAQALDLVGAYEQALQHDPAKLAADEALAAGREKAIQGDALLKPRVGLQANLGRLDDRNAANAAAGAAEHGSGTVRQVAVQLTQPLYDMTARAEKQQLHQQAVLAETQFSHARQAIAQRVAETYFGVLHAEEALRVTLAEKAAIAMQRDRAQARFDVGRGKATDLQEAKARHDQILSKEISARSTLELRRAQFEETTGAQALDLAALAAAQPATPPEPDSLAAWQVKGEDQSPMVRAKRSQLEIAGVEIDKYRASGRPTLSLVASYTHRGQSGDLSPAVAPNNDRSGYVGLQFSVPLYSGGGLDSKERESVSRKREAEHDLAAAKRDVRLQVQDAYLSVRTGVSRISAAEQSLTSARTALEATSLGRDVGTRTELDVLDAQQRAFTAEFDLVQARLDYLLGRVRLSAAAGELGEAELRAVNGWLTAR
ncbi:TolC family outer membrane protein [Roseateles sp. P5_D6]